MDSTDILKSKFIFYICFSESCDSMFFKCCFSTMLIYCDNERSSFSDSKRIFSKISLSIVMLIFSFKGFNSVHLVFFVFLKYYKI